MYQNIVTDKPGTFASYWILKEYVTQCEAEVRLEQDVQEFRNRIGRKAYLQIYPLGWATVRITAQP